MPTLPQLLAVVILVAGGGCISANPMTPRGSSSTFENGDSDRTREAGAYVHLCGSCSRPYAGQIRRAQALLEETCGGDFTVTSEGPSWTGNVCSADVGTALGNYYCWNVRCAKQIAQR